MEIKTVKEKEDDEKDIYSVMSVCLSFHECIGRRQAHSQRLCEDDGRQLSGTDRQGSVKNGLACGPRSWDIQKKRSMIYSWQAGGDCYFYLEWKESLSVPEEPIPIPVAEMRDVYGNNLVQGNSSDFYSLSMRLPCAEPRLTGHQALQLPASVQDPPEEHHRLAAHSQWRFH